MFVDSDTSDEYKFNLKEGRDYYYYRSSLLTLYLSAVEDIDIDPVYNWELWQHLLALEVSGGFQQKTSRTVKSVDLDQTLLLLGLRLNSKLIEELITIQAVGRANSRTLAENCFLILLDNLASDNIQVIQNIYNPEHKPSTYSVDKKTIDKSEKSCKFIRTCCKGRTYIQ